MHNDDNKRQFCSKTTLSAFSIFSFYKLKNDDIAFEYRGWTSAQHFLRFINI